MAISAFQPGLKKYIIKHSFLFLFCILLPSFAYAEECDLNSCFKFLKKGALPHYAKTKLEDFERDLKSIQQNSIMTLNEDDSVHELVGILNASHSSYHAINNYVAFGWNKNLEYLYWANVEAVKRGVAVTRTFIIADDILNDSGLLDKLVAIMEKQSSDGILVRYGLERDLSKDPAYKQYALMDAGFSDDAVFAQVTAVSIKGPQPAHVNITWDKELIKKRNPFEYLKASPCIKTFSKTTKKLLFEAAGRGQ